MHVVLPVIPWLPEAPLVAFFWVVAVATRLIREPRFVLVLVIWSAAVVGLLRLPAGTLRTALDLAAVGLGLAIVFWPQRLGLLGIRGTAADADATLRRASAWLRDAAHDRAAAGPIAASLAPDAFPLPSDEWAVAASLFRLAIRNAVLGDARSSSAQASAARGWWRAATERNLLGPRFRPRPFDEQMALRAAYEQYIALVPLQALAPDALVPVGGWDAEAEQVIERCATLRLRTPQAIEARAVLLATMRDHLRLARGDRSPEAYARQAASATRMQQAWDALAAMPAEELRDGRRGVPRP